MMLLQTAVVLIQQLTQTGRYHATVLVESPMPGSIETLDKQTFLRWKSKMHHTTGAETLKKAQEEARETAAKLELPEFCCFCDEALLSSNPIFVVVTPNFLNAEFLGDPDRKNPFIGVVGPVAPVASGSQIQEAIKEDKASQAYDKSVALRPLEMD